MIKLGAIIGAVPSLQKLAEKELPITAAYKLSKLLKYIQPELDTFNETKEKLAKKYGVFDEFTNTYEIMPEHMATANNEITALLNIEVKSPDMIQIPLDGDLRLSANDIGSLEPFIEFKAEGGDDC